MFELDFLPNRAFLPNLPQTELMDSFGVPVHQKPSKSRGKYSEIYRYFQIFGKVFDEIVII